MEAYGAGTYRDIVSWSAHLVDLSLSLSLDRCVCCVDTFTKQLDDQLGQV